MRNESICDNQGHIWYCTQGQGLLDEIKASRKLGEEEIGLLEENPKLVQDVCPGGAVNCFKCHMPFPGTEGSVKPQETDIQDLQSKLVK